jgi:hypothetical protein
MKYLLNENGYMIYNKLFEDNDINILILDMINVVKKYCDYYNIEYDNKLKHTDLLYNLLYNLYNIDNEIYFSFIKQNGVFANIYNIKKLFSDNKITKILEILGYNNVSVPITSQINLYCNFAINKNYRNGEIGLDAHQDWPQTRGSINNIILWIALTDINEYNCPLLVIPKSHLEGFINGKQNTHNIIIDKYSDDKYKKIVMNNGDCIILNGWLVHKTGIFENNEKIRIAITLRFNDFNDNYFISTLYKTSYNITMDRNIDQTKIPYQDIILKEYNNNKIVHYLDLYNKRKFWYNNIGINIENPFEKLMKLQRFIKCDDLSKEIYEQLYVVKYLDRNSKVLELGGNKGRVSLIIASILYDEKNLEVFGPCAYNNWHGHNFEIFVTVKGEPNPET